ncbi:EamA family transporter [uncultured Ruegeria sp.]|uniref:EamA family transporter n=1 Tax=uncultured Ruegeria sp. TaxID=259304 RepID=UPI00260A0F50|nr:EamA family transporter [uncultured Ruegeria sp.]
MTTHALLIVLTAAFLHALWNAVVKGAPDKAIVLGLVALGHAIPALFALPFIGLPVWAAFPFVIGSTLIHWGYYWFLNTAYKHGDLSVVYPISRGMTPILVTVGAILFAGEILPPVASIGIVCISVGIGCLSLAGLGRHTNWIAVAAAFGTGVMIASYSIVDGIGIRLSGNTLGYIAVLFVAEIFVAGFIFTTRWRRLVALPRRYVWAGLAGGVISGLAYGLVLYAKTIAPLGVVSALRESSVIFASIIGVMWFGEGPKSNRLLAAIIVAIGIVVLAMAR